MIQNDEQEFLKQCTCTMYMHMFASYSGLKTYFFRHSQTFASCFNLNSRIAVSNSQLVFPTFEQFLTLRCGMAIVSWGWNLVHHSPLSWQRTCWRLHSSFLRLKKYIYNLFFPPLPSHGKTASLCYEALQLFHCLYCRVAETSLRPRFWYEMKNRTRSVFRVPLFSTRKTEFQLAFFEFASMKIRALILAYSNPVLHSKKAVFVLPWLAVHFTR